MKSDIRNKTEREKDREKCILENQPSESFRIFAFKIDKKAKFLFTIIII